MPRKRNRGNPLPDVLPTKEQFEAYLWCVREGIIISPLATKVQGQWKIGISNHWEPRSVKESPDTFDKNEIWEKVYEYYMYYYDKRKKSHLE